MSIDRSMLPQTLSNLKISNVDELKKIYQKFKNILLLIFHCFIRAVELRQKTPDSFFLKINETGIFTMGMLYLYQNWIVIYLFI